MYFFRFPRTLAIAALCVFGALGTGCGSYGASCRADRYAFVSQKIDDALDDLDATEEQRKKIHDLKDKLVEEAMQLRAQGRQARQAGFEEWKKDKPDAARVHRLVDERVDAFRGLLHKAADAILEAHGALTPEQRAKVTERVQKHLERWDND